MGRGSLLVGSVGFGDLGRVRFLGWLAIDGVMRCVEENVTRCGSTRESHQKKIFTT